MAENAGAAVALTTSALALLSMLICLLAAVNIAHALSALGARAGEGDWRDAGGGRLARGRARDSSWRRPRWWALAGGAAGRRWRSGRPCGVDALAAALPARLPLQAATASSPSLVAPWCSAGCCWGSSPRSPAPTCPAAARPPPTPRGPSPDEAATSRKGAFVGNLLAWPSWSGSTAATLRTPSAPGPRRSPPHGAADAVVGGPGARCSRVAGVGVLRRGRCRGRSPTRTPRATGCCPSCSWRRSSWTWSSPSAAVPVPGRGQMALAIRRCCSGSSLPRRGDGAQRPAAAAAPFEELGAPPYLVNGEPATQLAPSTARGLRRPGGRGARRRRRGPYLLRGRRTARWPGSPLVGLPAEQRFGAPGLFARSGDVPIVAVVDPRRPRTKWSDGRPPE